MLNYSPKNIIKFLHEYFVANNVIGAKSLNAPILNVKIFLPLEVVPYGKITKGGVC